MILIMQCHYTKIIVVRVYVRVGGHRKLFDLDSNRFFFSAKLKLEATSRTLPTLPARVLSLG